VLGIISVPGNANLTPAYISESVYLFDTIERKHKTTKMHTSQA